jgi:hypothetical protein
MPNPQKSPQYITNHPCSANRTWFFFGTLSHAATGCRTHSMQIALIAVNITIHPTIKYMSSEPNEYVSVAALWYERARNFRVKIPAGG